MSNQFIAANNASTTLAQALSATTTTINLATGTGALFPSPTAGQQFAVTLIDALTGLVNEICYCTSRTGDQLTVARGQEGTAATTWLIGDSVQNLWTAGQANQLYSVYNTITGQLGPVGVYSNSSVTIPNGVSYFRFWGARAGGSGGGGSIGNNSAGSGGAGSPVVDGGFAVTPGDTVSFVIGAGGVGGVGANGGSGGSTVISHNGTPVLTIGGGTGGYVGNNGFATSSAIPGSVTSTSGVSTFIKPGAPGGNSGDLSENAGIAVFSAVGGGPGDGSYTAQFVVLSTVAANGLGAPNYGGGGGSGVNGGNGANGGNGCLSYGWG